MSSLEGQMVEFSSDLYKVLVSEDPAENVFMSPASIVLVLYMVYTGAGGNTANQMNETLKLKNVTRVDLMKSVKKLVATLKSGSQNFQLSVASKIFPHVDKSILGEFVKEVSTNFQTDISPKDFTNNPDGCRKEINEWVERETKDKIKELIAPGVITDLTAMVLVNAIYFKGDWQDKFDTEDTRKENFVLTNGDTVSVDMMHKRFKKVAYGENQRLSCQVLQIPYKGEEVSMVIILPGSHNGLPELEKKLNGQVVVDLITNLRQVLVQVALPKFKAESSFQLAAALSKLGMPELFDESKADLSRMSKEQLYVSHVIHKAFVDVNEEGSEAAAATAAVIQRRSIQIAMEFRANHPFLYMIWDNRMNLPLFMGRMTKPPNSMPPQKEEL